MDAKEYIRERERMLNTFGRTEGYCSGVSCTDCPLYQDERANCDTESAVDIVEAWSAEHPKKTYLDVLLKAFPNTPMSHGAPLYMCPNYIGLILTPENICTYEHTNCATCWNREYKEADK